MVDLAILNINLTILLVLYAALVGFALGPDVTTQDRVNTPSQNNDIDLRNVSFEYPVTLEPEVINQIRLLQGPMNPSLAVWLSRRGRYEALISAELRRAQMPKELLAVAMIESGFSPDAFSPAGAVGLWQFMHSTATSMGARIDDWVDERRHVQASTRLAIKLLQKNYKRFQDWHLALAAYNAGAGAVERAIKKSGSSNYWTIIRMGHLPREASQYVPRAIAGMIAIRVPALFGQESLRLQSQPRLEYVSVSSGTDLHRLAKNARVSVESILQHNPQLRRGIVPPDGHDFALSVPADLVKQLKQTITQMDKERGDTFIKTTLRFGEKLRTVAWRRRISLRKLRDWNAHPSGHSIQTGEEVLVPASSTERSLRDLGLVSLGNPHLANQGTHPIWFPVIYPTQVSQIARWFNVNPQQLRLWNQLSDEPNIPAGYVIKIWLDGPPPKNTLTVQAEDIIFSDRLGPAIHGKHPRADALTISLHTVKAGDNLWKLAKDYRTSVRNIVTENGMETVFPLRPGMKVKIPHFAASAYKRKGKSRHRTAKPTGRGRKYRVRKGDSLWKIAKKFRTSVRKLKAVNGLRGRRGLKAGQTIRIPGR